MLVIALVIGLVDINTKFKNSEAKNTQNESKINDLYDEKYSLQMKNDNLREDLFKLSEARNLLELQVNLTADEKNKLEMKLSSLQEEFINLQLSTSISAVKSDSVEDLEAQLENLRRIIDDKVGEVKKLDATAREVAELMNQKIVATAELETGMKALEGRICDGKKVLENLESEILTTNNQLQQLANLKASVLKVEEGVGSVWELTPGDGHKRLIELLHELVELYGNTYPILRKELLKIEWSTVWLPQLQQLCVREGLDKSGIYKLTLKSNDRVVYIGQAQSIKDRWYTHCKKMLGVEAKGTERLYDYRPDEMTWEVVEFKEGNLDSDEKYWIDYYKCREIGLNKKC